MSYERHFAERPEITKEQEKAEFMRLLDLAYPALDLHPDALHPDLAFDDYYNPDWLRADPQWVEYSQDDWAKTCAENPREVDWSTHAADSAFQIEHGTPHPRTVEALLAQGFEEYAMSGVVLLDQSNKNSRIIGLTWIGGRTDSKIELWALANDANLRRAAIVKPSRLECLAALLSEEPTQ